MVYNGLGKNNFIPFKETYWLKHKYTNTNNCILWHMMKNEQDDKLFLVARCIKTSDTWD